MNMIRNLAAAIAIAGLQLLSAPADATTQWPTTTPGESSVGSVTFGCVNGSGQWVPALTTGQCLGSGGGGGSTTGFTPNGAYGSLTATASTSASTALPAASATVRLTNLGSGTVSCTFATGAATGLVNNAIIGPLSSISRVIGSYDHVACIDQTGSTGSQLVILEGGSGLGNDTGGGGGGGSSGAVFGPTANGSAAANPPVVIGGTADGTGTGNVANWKVVAGIGYINAAQLNGVALGSPSVYGTSPGAVNVPGVNAFVTNTVPVTGTFWQATQPVSATALPLPTGAATAAKQPALGTAGTPSADVISVQGVTGGTPQPSSMASGAAVDGWDATQGTKTDTAYSGTGSGSVVSILKWMGTTLNSMLTAIQSAIPSQSPAVPIGGMGICDGANGTTNPCTNAATVKGASTAPGATDKALVAALSPNTGEVGTPQTAVSQPTGGVGLSGWLSGIYNKLITSIAVTQTSQYPSGAIPLTASATGTTAATTATLTGAVGKTTYICGYSIRANATATTTVTNTLTGVITATMSSIMWVPANTAGLGVDEQIFSPCIPASGTNQAIAAVSGAPGAGGVVSSKAWGYQQ